MDHHYTTIGGVVNLFKKNGRINYVYFQEHNDIESANEMPDIAELNYKLQKKDKLFVRMSELI